MGSPAAMVIPGWICQPCDPRSRTSPGPPSCWTWMTGRFWARARARSPAIFSTTASPWKAGVGGMNIPCCTSTTSSALRIPCPPRPLAQGQNDRIDGPDRRHPHRIVQRIRPGGELDRGQLSRRIDQDHLPEDAEGGMPAGLAVEDPPLPAIGRLGKGGEALGIERREGLAVARSGRPRPRPPAESGARCRNPPEDRARRGAHSRGGTR